MSALRHNLADLNRALFLYQRQTGKTRDEVLLRQGSNAAFFLRRELKGLTPPKGSIRAERLAAIAAGGGILIRPAILAKEFTARRARSNLRTRQTVFGARGVRSVKARTGGRANLFALAVKRELSARESARGFVPQASRFPRKITAKEVARSRFGPVLGRIKLLGQESLVLEWGPEMSGLSALAAEGISKPRGLAALNRAIRETRADILTYLRGRLKKSKKEAGFKA